jgi:hypothetical protein
MLAMENPYDKCLKTDTHIYIYNVLRKIPGRNFFNRRVLSCAQISVDRFLLRQALVRQLEFVYLRAVELHSISSIQ